MAPLKNSYRPGPIVTTRRVAGSRRHRPAFDSLEGRTLLTLGFTSALGLGGDNLDVGHSAIDSAGDTYVTGDFTGTVNFSSGSGSAVLDAGSLPRTFVAKYSPTNTLLWVKDFAPVGSSVSGGTGLTVDDTTGSVYVVGFFSGTVNFDPDGGSSNVSSLSGSSDGYVVELTANGNLDAGRVRVMSGPGFDRATNVSLSYGGQGVFVTGTYTGNANFDPGGTNTVLSSPAANASDAYVLKLTNDLGYVYARGVGVANSTGFAVTTDSSGSAYVVGASYAPTQGFLSFFDPTTGTPFVAKVDPAGNLVSVFNFGGTTATASGVVSDGTNVYVAGVFAGSGANFNPAGTPSTTLDSMGASNEFLVKLDPSLNLLWARRIGPVIGSGLADLGIDGGNSLYLSGSRTSALTFSPVGSGTAVLAIANGASNTPHGFVVVVNSDGIPVQTVNIGGDGASSAEVFAVNKAGHGVLVGYYQPPASFGGTVLQTTLGASQVFVATLAPDSSNSTPPPPPIITPPPPIIPPPSFVGAMRLYAGQKRRRKLVGFQIQFSSALNSAVALNLAHYHASQPGRNKRAAPKAVGVVSATYNSSNNSVTLVLGKFAANKALTLTVTGLLGSSGSPVATTVTSL